MTHRCCALFGLFLGLATASVAADYPTRSDFDQNVVETLKNVHNQGADLYNTGDSSGCLRMYQGALQTIAPLLSHHPAIKQTINEGLSSVGKLEGTRAQAFRLHELIEQVRSQLKDEVKKAAQPEPKKIDPKPEPKKPEPAPMPKPEPKKPEPAPMPKPEPKKPEPKAAAGAVSGKLTIDGKPAAAAEVTFVTLGTPQPQVYSAKVSDGAFTFPQPLPVGKYAVMVTGSAQSKIADKFQTVQSSGLTADVTAKPNTLNLDLQSK
ncbi:MAG: hypothetical protein LC104_11495 [Bacteroidales bacterium]|nr:hypothetical protein [Bacteroidales bacterium]